MEQWGHKNHSVIDQVSVSCEFDFILKYIRITNSNIFYGTSNNTILTLNRFKYQ